MNKDSEFEQIFNIMEQSFPKSEIREYEEQKIILNNDKYHIITSKSPNGDINGFLTFWNLESVNFIEHIAVKDTFRGKGIGSRLICKYLSETCLPTILEVEAPLNETAVRRIKFYEKSGFYLNLYFYSQPSFVKGGLSIPMYIMSSPNKINFNEFILLRKEIYKKIYFL